MFSDHKTLHGPADERQSGWLLLLLALVVLGAGIALRDPWPADEPRFALIAKQMVESGQWLFPFRGGEVYPDKPPLFMWAIALFYQLTGSLRIAFLLPSLLAGLGTLGLVYDIARRLWDRKTAFRAGLLLLFTVQFTLQAKTAQIDALVTGFITLGLYGFLRFLLCGGGWRWYYLGWFAAGLGIITKGRLRHLPVVDGGELVGLVSIGDLVNAQLEEQRFIISQMENYIVGNMGDSQF